MNLNFLNLPFNPGFVVNRFIFASLRKALTSVQLTPIFIGVSIIHPYGSIPVFHRCFFQSSSRCCSWFHSFLWHFFVLLCVCLGPVDKVAKVCVYIWSVKRPFGLAVPVVSDKLGWLMRSVCIGLHRGRRIAVWQPLGGVQVDKVYSYGCQSVRLCVLKRKHWIRRPLQSQKWSETHLHSSCIKTEKCTCPSKKHWTRENRK